MAHTLDTTRRAVTPVDDAIAADVDAHLDDLTKPRGSLGRLEELARAYCLMRGTASPTFGLMEVYCFAGDHGVAEEGVSAFPREVTPQMVANMAGGGAAINVLTRHVGARLQVVDMGVAADLRALPGLKHCKVRAGTNNIARGPAMSVDEARQALETGIALAAAAADEGVTLLGTGEMGIANTTPSAALFCACLGCTPRAIVGYGTGLDEDGVRHKAAVVERALEVNADRPAGPLNTLAALGGFEIAGIAGLVLGAAARRIPVVVDGFISTAGATVACELNESVRDYLFFSHLSRERGHALVMQALEAMPILDLGMRLGEGTGAALAMSIIEAAVKLYNEMATFSAAGVSHGG